MAQYKYTEICCIFIQQTIRNYQERSTKQTNRKEVLSNPTYNCIKKNELPRNKFNKEVKDAYTNNYNN